LTPEQKAVAFIARWEAVVAMVTTGTPIGLALVASLEDDDWGLVYAATTRLVNEVATKRATVVPFPKKPSA
jgi:hypothetical protein